MRRALLGSLALAGCTAREAAPPTPPAAPAPVAPKIEPTPTPAPEPASASAGFEGRWAVDIGKTTSATHARNLYREATRASFVLDLDPGGQAHACRGIRTRTSNDGPTVHNGENTRSQQGYRGRWEVRGEWVHVDLELDAGRCAASRLYENLAPKAWRLRCRALAPGDRGEFKGPLLACALDNAAEHQYRESYGYFVPEVTEGEWLLLAPGDGLRVEWHDDTLPPEAGPSQVTLKPAASRVEDDTWSRP